MQTKRPSSSITDEWLFKEKAPVEEVEALMVEAVLEGGVFNPEGAALAVSRVQLLKFRKWNN